MRQDVVAAAIVDSLERPTRLLAARRTAPSRLAGGWEFPGGKVEEGEDHVSALHREVSEELGVRIELGKAHLGPDAGAWPLGEHFRMLVFLARVVDGVPEPLEDHDELRWLEASDLESVPWLRDDLPVVRGLRSLLGTRDS